MTRNVLFLSFLVAFGALLVVTVRTSSLGLGSFAETPFLSPLGSPAKINSETAIPPLFSTEIERLNLLKDLTEEINAEGITDNVSLYYKNLRDNYEVMINPDRSWIPASTVKAYVVVEAYRQKRLRLINFDSRVTISPENVVPTELESHDYQPLRAGVKATIRELIEAMITQSDNTAYNTLIDVLDRRNITSNLRKLGLNDTDVGEKLSLADIQYQVDAAVAGHQPNRTTAHNMGRLFDLLYQKKVDDSEEILTIFKKQKFKDMIPAPLPLETIIAHKTGVWSPYYHDGGIVYKPNEPYVLVIFTNRDDATVISRLSKIAYYKSRDVLGVSTASIKAKILELLLKLSR